MDQNESEPNVIYVQTPEEKFKLEGRLCSLSAYSFIPTHRFLPQERNFFNSPKTIPQPSFDFDLVFPPIVHDYNQRQHRCDRRFARMMGLETNKEEHTKKVPSLSSTYCGFYLNRKPVDHHSRQFARTQVVKAEFYRNNGALKLDNLKQH